MARKFVFSFLILGLVALLAVPAEATNIVVNGSFETGNFSGWTQFGNTGFTGLVGAAGAGPTDGAWQAFFGPVGSTGGIFQNIATTAGASYWFSFDVENLGSPTNSFAAAFDGVTVLSIVNSGPLSYTSYLFVVQATGALTNVRFTTRQDPSFWLLDNVSVQAVPEPGSLLLLATGLAAGARAVRRRYAGRK